MSKKPQADSFFDLFQQFGRNLQVPNAQVQDVMDQHRKNIEAMQKIARTTSSGTQALMAKQRESLQEALGEITRMVQGAAVPGDPGQMISDQVEFARRSFEATVKNAAEMGEVMRETGTESFDILRERVEDSIEDIRKGMEKK